MKGWNALPVETQERIIGRKKLSDIELKDAEKPPYAHNALTVIEENGKEVKILRDNMPFGRPGHGEFGTYFIGYSRTPRITETMLQNMFVGRPPGNYDRILDFSKAATGSLFFAPSSTFLDNISGDPPNSADIESSLTSIATPASSAGDTSPNTLGIGSLKGHKDE
jgi:putative iron-dependent peroxidase